MDIHNFRKDSFMLLECISGSKAYGLDTPQSDTDLKGVFLLSQKAFYGLETIEQVNNETNDEVYYELKRFVDLLLKNNPNILEMLGTPPDCILQRNPLMDLLKPELFLSKLCHQTFAGYAISQIKKAKGLNKKIVNPVEQERKSVLDFCYLIQGQGSIPLQNWLEKRQWKQEDCGLVNINHMREIYALFHQSQLKASKVKGIISGPESNDISLSSIEELAEPAGILSFNKDGYSSYCRKYREYWDWVEKRNETRYQNTIDHGKNYDAKNLMHTFRLLHMAEEIAREGSLHVRRTDRDFLLKIRSGAFDYEELVKRADDKILEIDELYQKSPLPELPDYGTAEQILVEIRQSCYKAV